MYIKAVNVDNYNLAYENTVKAVLANENLNCDEVIISSCDIDRIYMELDKVSYLIRMWDIRDGINHTADIIYSLFTEFPQTNTIEEIACGKVSVGA